MVQEKNKASSFCFDCLIPHVRNNIGGGGGHSAVVVLLGHQNVAVIAPERRPGVLHEPVFLKTLFNMRQPTEERIVTTDLSIQLPVADSQHRVIQAVNVTAALLLEVNSIGVEAEAFVRSINSNGHWTMSGDSDLG